MSDQRMGSRRQSVNQRIEILAELNSEREEEVIEETGRKNVLNIEIDRMDEMLEPGVINYVESVGVVKLIDKPHTQSEQNEESEIKLDQAIVNYDITPVNSERNSERISEILDRPDPQQELQVLEQLKELKVKEAQELAARKAAGLRQAEFDALNNFKEEESKAKELLSK